MEYEPQASRDIERLIWQTVVEIQRVDLPAIVDDLLDRYTRTPGMDAVTRLTPTCISSQSYELLLTSLKGKARRHVWFVDHGWHVEMRLRLRQYLYRGLQRWLVVNGLASDRLVEDLLAYDVGI